MYGFWEKDNHSDSVYIEYESAFNIEKQLFLLKNKIMRNDTKSQMVLILLVIHHSN